MGKKKSFKPSEISTSNDPSGSDDWIAALAKKSATQESTAALPSKAERIEKRKAKKRRREERKPVATVNSGVRNNVHEQNDDRPGKRMNRMSEAYLNLLSSTVEHRITALHESSLSWSRPYEPQTEKKGKATPKNQLNDEMIQPRRRDYGGLGLARPSILISLRDPSFVPKLEEEFGEHVPGFFGKQKTKAMKKQLDGNMLWRQLAEKRTDNRKLNGKKLFEMSPDERIQAMIKAGMI